MEPKKNPKVSLENKKAMFFQIGLAVTLLAILIAFEWKSYDKSNYNLGDLNLDDMEAVSYTHLTLPTKRIV